MTYSKKQEVNNIIGWANSKFPESALPINDVKPSIKYLILCIDIFDFLLRVTDDNDLKELLEESRTVYMWLLYYLLDYSDAAYYNAIRSTAEWTMRLCVKCVDNEIKFSELSKKSHKDIWMRIKNDPYFDNKELLNNINNLFANASSNMHRGVYSSNPVIDFLNDIINKKCRNEILKINKNIKYLYDFLITEIWNKGIFQYNDLTISQKIVYKNLDECLKK